uniref:Uncharacterized protein n=1 Tax=Romanomermis culicivorax TaxID=13658 RepID=A0A915HII6_ROMCU
MKVSTGGLFLAHLKGHLYLPFSMERNGSPTGRNVQPENALLVEKDKCNFVDNDGNLQSYRTERKFPFRSVTLCQLHSVPSHRKRKV